MLVNVVWPCEQSLWILKKELSYLISAPAMKHPGFEEMRTTLLTALFSQTSFITSVISFCIWIDSVLTCKVKYPSRFTSHWHHSEVKVLN